MISAIIVAAGSGRRLKLAVPKPLVKIAKLPAIIYSLKALNAQAQVKEIILVVSAANRQAIATALKRYRFKKLKSLVLGGPRRQDSVRNGLAATSVDTHWVLVHDAARPLIGRLEISKVILAAKRSQTAILGVPVKATIKKVKSGNFVDQTLERNSLWEIQTPQVFKKEIILQAYQRFGRSLVTDDAALVEKLGQPVKIVLGSYDNIKITTKEDLLLAEAILGENVYEI